MIANVGIATYLFAVQDISWLLSAIAGVLVGVVWNYSVTSIFTWNLRRGAGSRKELINSNEFGSLSLIKRASVG